MPPRATLLVSAEITSKSPDSSSGPLLFNAKDAPYYIPGIRGVLGIFSAQLACVGVQVVVLFFLNRARRRQRVAAGKPEYIKDTSMMAQYEAYGGEGDGLGQNGECPARAMPSVLNISS